MQRKGVAGSWVLLWWLFWYGTSSGTSVFWWEELWCLWEQGAGGNSELPQLWWVSLAAWAVWQPCPLAFACWPPLRLLGRLSAVGHWCPGCVPDGCLLLGGEQNGCLVLEDWSPLPPLGMVFDVWCLGHCLLEEAVQWFLLAFSQCESRPRCSEEVCLWACPWESSQLGLLLVMRSWPCQWDLYVPPAWSSPLEGGGYLMSWPFRGLG